MTEGDVAADVRRRVHRSTARFWRPTDFAGSPAAVAKALSRLVEAGELRRVRRGLYWRGTMTPFGMAPPPPTLLAEEVVAVPGSGPAGLSAANALGLSTQVPRHEAIAVPARVPRNPANLRVVSRAASSRRRDERLRPEEVALFEVLRDWSALVELDDSEAIARIGRLMADGTLRRERLVRAARSEPPVVRAGLRALLAAAGWPREAEAVSPPRSAKVHHQLATAG